MKRQKIKKWQFYSVAAEEMMSYVDDDEESDVFSITKNNKQSQNNHYPTLVTKDFEKKIHLCMICSMEESVMNKVLGSKETNIRKRKFARRKTNLASCSDPNCMVIAHTLCPVGTRMNTLPQFAGMNCFEIAHTREASTLFTKIQ